MARMYRMLALWLAGRSWFRSFAGPRVLTKVDRFLVARTGRSLTAPSDEVFPVLNLTATGAMSGQPRTVPLIYVPAADGLIVVGTNWGRDGHPAWSTNLIATPAATVRCADHEGPVLAEQLGSEEVADRWEELAGVMPLWEDYRQVIDSREIRVFRLVPQR